MKQLIQCYHVAEEEDTTEDNLHNIHILELQGEREVEGPNIDSQNYDTLLNIKKVNIGIAEKKKWPVLEIIWIIRQ